MLLEDDFRNVFRLLKVFLVLCLWFDGFDVGFELGIEGLRIVCGILVVVFCLVLGMILIMCFFICLRCLLSIVM